MSKAVANTLKEPFTTQRQLPTSAQRMATRKIAIDRTLGPAR
jgi:hypothetical protein